MKGISIIVYLICIPLCCPAQTNDTSRYYYKNRYMDKMVPVEKGKFRLMVINHADGKVTTEKLDVKKNQVYERETKKGEEPFGIWVYMRGSGPAEMDYEFTLEYSKQGCPDDVKVLTKPFDDDPALAYKAPILSTGEKFYEFVNKHLIYPAYARRRGIEGRVFLNCTVTEDGVIENVKVIKGVHVSLDKEAARVLRKAKLSSPPRINGNQVKVCAEFPITFKLG